MTTPPPPAILWDEQGQPKSALFDDYYFNTDSGLAESRYVFLDKNNLSSRWQSLCNANPATFTIAETGFGTGLNFLAAWQLWQANAPASACLHFISVEKYPLSRAQLQQALKLWPALQPFSAALVSQYPEPQHSTVNRLHFHDGRVQLTLIFEDAISGLKQLLPAEGTALRVAQMPAHYSPWPHTVDAWFLDGFAPAKNPDMWQPELYRLMAKLSHPGTTLATFTAIKAVRTGLNDVGFCIKKATGFGQKREMVTAIFEGPLQPPTEPAQALPKSSRQRAQNAAIPKASWHLMPPTKTPRIQHVAIIGAGLAGAHTAFALAKRGIKVSVYEQHTIANGASGNPQGVVYTRFSHQRDTLAEFNASALPFADAFYHNHHFYSRCGGRTGVLHLATSTKHQEQQQTIAQRFCHTPHYVQWLNHAAAEQCAGIALPSGMGGLFTPLGGWLQPAHVCQLLLAQPNIHVYEGCNVHALTLGETRWQLSIHTKDHGAHAQHTADAVVLANTYSARQFAQAEYLHLKPIRGQITQATVAPTAGKRLSINTCICGEGYIAPPLAHSAQQHITFGATFAPKDPSPEVTEADNQANIAMLKQLVELPSPLSLHQGRTAFRCTTRDYLPFIGPVSHSQATQNVFAQYRKNKYAVIDNTGQFYRNLYINVGHGARGLAYTPLAAEILASLITGQALPVSEGLYKQLHPARFIIRDLAQNKM